MTTDLDCHRAYLDAQLAGTARESLATTITRFVNFLGSARGAVIELQALHVPVARGGFAVNRYAHVFSAAAAAVLLEQAETWKAEGLYVLANKVHDAVSTRRPPGEWHDMRKGEGTTDADVVARRVLYVDIDAVRPRGTSSTDDELARANDTALQIFAYFADVLGTTSSLGFGRSGNGCAVLVALDDLPISDELDALIETALHALDSKFSGPHARIDTSVRDAKRLVPAFGTIKRKGSPGVAERPHRRTAFVGDEIPLRLSLDDVRRLRRALCPVSASAVTSPVVRAKQRAPDSANTPFAQANAVDVRAVAAWLGLLDGDEPRCPGCGESRGVAFVGNGFKCSHNRCSQKGFRRGFRTVVDLVCEARNVAPAEALTLLAERFGLTLPRAPRHANSESIAERPDSDSDATAKQRVLALLRDIPLFVSPTGRIFADIEGDALPLDSVRFFRWVAHRYLNAHNDAVGRTTIEQVALALAGAPIPCRDVSVRIGGDSDRIEIDLADAEHRSVEVTAISIRVLDRPTAAFLRPAGTAPLPCPILPTNETEAGEVFTELRRALGVDDDNTWGCELAWLVAALRPVGPYPVLLLRGEQGSGKSTQARLLRLLLDPRRPELKTLPRDARDLAIGAEHAHVLAFDNLSVIDAAMSDCLCRLATGDGFETRALYTGRDLDVFEAARPVLITSISDAATRPDLLDRALLVRLPQRRRRVDEVELHRAVFALRARVLGALAFAAHVALRRLEATQVPSSIRMLAPARFAAAAEPALGVPDGAIVRAYLESRHQALSVVAADVVVEAIVEFLAAHAGAAGSSWTGTAGQLLKLLDARRGGQRAPRGWPETARGMRSAIDRNTPALRDLGVVEVSRGRLGHGRDRIVELTYSPPQPTASLNGHGEGGDDLASIVSMRC